MRYNPHRRHSPGYYRAILLIIIPGLAQSLAYEVIRLQLAASGHPSPTGGEWTIPSLNGIVARLRKREGNFYRALLEMYFGDEFTKNEVSKALRSL